MSINVGVTASNPLTLTPATAAMTLAPATHQITATSNNAVTVSAGLESLALAKFNTQINTNVIVQPPLELLALNTLLPTVEFTPIQGDVTVDCNNETLVLTEQNPSISTSDLKTWSYRANQPDVVQKCNFSTAAEIQAITDNRLKGPGSGGSPEHAGAEDTIKVSGDYSLRQSILPSDGNSANPNWGFSFGEVLGDGSRSAGETVPALSNPPPQFGVQTGGAEDLGNEMYIQWRQYWPLASLDILWKVDGGRGGWKFLKVVQGHYFNPGATWAGSVWNKELTFANYGCSNMPGIATGASAVNGIESVRNTSGQEWTEGAGDPNPGMIHAGGTNDAVKHNAFGVGPNLEDNPSTFSLRTKAGTGTCVQGFGCNLDWVSGNNFPDPQPGNQITWSGPKKNPFRGQTDKVFEFVPNEWITFKVHVSLGTRNGGFWENSRVRFYGQRDGLPSVLFTDVVIDLEHAEGGVPASQEGYGQLFFTPFQTGLQNQSVVDVRDTYNTYIDEIIVSKSDIADSVAALEESPTELDKAIAPMAVGEWKAFNNNWPVSNMFNESYDVGTGHENPEHAVSWNNANGYHDAARNRIVFIGCGYATGVVIASYDIANDTWSRYRHSTTIHIWDHSAYDRARGVIYYGNQSGGGQRSFPIDDPDNLTTGLEAPWGGGIDTYGMDFFPEIDSVVFYNHRTTTSQAGDIRQRPVTGGSTTDFATGLNTAAGWNSWLTYNPVRGVLYFGPGTSSPYEFGEVDSNANVNNSLPNSPYIRSYSQSTVCGEVTGDLVVFDGGGGGSLGAGVHRYRHGIGWTLDHDVMQGAAAYNACALRGYAGKEIFMLLRRDGGGSGGEASVFLYRYS